MSRPVLGDSGGGHLALADVEPTGQAPEPLPPELLASSYQWLYHHHPGLARLACSHVTRRPHPPQPKDDRPTPATTDALPSRRQEEREEPRSRAKTYSGARENKVRSEGWG